MMSFADTVMLGVIVLFAVGLLLFATGRIARAGLAVVAAALLPTVAQEVVFPHSDVPGFAYFLTLTLLPIPLVVLVWGVTLQIARWRRGHAERLLHSN
jgi:hypothetical protein